MKEVVEFLKVYWFEIVKFLQIYWKEILYALCAVLSVISFIFRKSKIKVVDSAYEVVVQRIPSLINKAEMFFSNGIDKKKFVVDTCVSLLSEITHKPFEAVSIYSERFSRVVEDILSTPTKKGVKYETKNEKEC